MSSVSGRYNSAPAGQPFFSTPHPSYSVEDIGDTEEATRPPSQFEIDLEALNDQTSALEVGEKGTTIGEDKFDRYERLILNGINTLLEKYKQVANESDPQLRHAGLQAILTDLKLINSAREDFAMLIRRDYGVDLDEAKTRGREALLTVVGEYKQSLDKIEAIHRELSKQIALRSQNSGSNMGYAANVACSVIKNVSGFVCDFTHGLFHPAKILRVNNEEEVTRSNAKIQEELQVLIQGVARDKEFLAGLYETGIAEAAKEEGIYQYRGWWIDPITQRQHRFEAKRSCRENDEKFNQALAISKKDPSTLTEKEKEIMRAVEKEERYKKNVYRVVLGIHALSWGISAYRIYYHDAPLLKAQAVNMHEEVKKAVPKEAAYKIDKETSFLIDRLSHDYEKVKNRNFPPVHRQRYPLAIQALEKYITQYPDSQPTGEEISRFCDAFKLDLLIQNSPHPGALLFRSMSPFRWWKTFATEQEQAPQTNQSLLLEHHVDSQIVDKIDHRLVFAAADHDNLFFSARDMNKFNSREELNIHESDSAKHILATHAWEIGGYGRVGARIIKREGMLPINSANYMLQSLTHFHESYPGEMTTEEYEFLREAMTDYIVDRERILKFERKDMAVTIQRYQAGLPIIILSGYYDHGVEIIIWKEHLIINNKGDASRRPIEIYRMNSARIIPSSEFAAKVGEIIGLNLKKRSDYVNWLNAVCEKFGTTNSDFERILEESYPMENKQKVGNCAWESYETSIFALIALHRMVSKGFTKCLAQDGKLSEARIREMRNELQDSGRVFLGWVQFTMLSTLEDYLDHHKEPENVASPLDHDLITKIILQSRQLPAWQIDLYPKMNRLIEQYLSRNDFVEKGIGDPERNPEGHRLFDQLVGEGLISDERIFGFVEKAVGYPETTVVWHGLMLITPLMTRGALSDEQVKQVRAWIEKALGFSYMDSDATDVDVVKRALKFIHMLENKESLSADQVEQVFVFARKAIGNQHEPFARKGLDCIAPLVQGGHLSVEQVAVLIETALEHSHVDIAEKGFDFIDLFKRKATFTDFLTGKRTLIDYLTGKKYFTIEQTFRFAMKAYAQRDRIFIHRAADMLMSSLTSAEYAKLTDEQRQFHSLLKESDWQLRVIEHDNLMSRHRHYLTT